MGKDKLKRFSEIASFQNVFQPNVNNFISSIELKGKWHDVFENSNPIIVELGCGKGEYSVGLARNYLNYNFVGIDIKGSRMWRGAKTCIEENINNVRFLRTKIDYVDLFFNKNEVAEIWLTFSDPQAKKPRKRLTSPLFIDRYRKFLKKDGKIHLKTDSDLLFEYTLEQIKDNNYNLIDKSDDVYSDRTLRANPTLTKAMEIKTFYEKIWLKEGKKIKYLCFSIH